MEVVVLFLSFTVMAAGSNYPPRVTIQDMSLITALERIIESSPAESISIAFYDLETGAEALIEPDTRYHPASTMKVPVMIEVYQQARERRFALDDRIPVRNEFASIADGSKFPVARGDDADPDLHDRIGQTESIRELVRRMIVRSSNLATNILVDLVGAEKITRSMNALGASDMVVLRGVEDNRAYERGLNNSATARSLMMLMSRIALGTAVSREDSREMARILMQQEFNEGIPAGLPRSVKAAHKTGWIANIYHDAAIVHPRGRKPYVLIVMTRGIGEVKGAHRIAADISREVYRSLQAEEQKTGYGNWDQ